MAHQSVYTGDMTTGTWVLDFSALTLVPPFEAGLLTLWDAIPKAVDGTNARKFEWTVEENLINTVTLGANLTAGSGNTTLTVTGDGLAKAGIRVGALLRNFTDKTKPEIVRVTGVTSATAATVERDYGGFVGDGDGSTHFSGNKLEVVTQLNFEGSGVAKTDFFGIRDRDLGYNYYSILDDHTVMSGSDLASIYRGNFPSNWAYQVAGMADRFRVRQEKTMCLSPMVERTSSEEGSMGGLLWQATRAAQVAAGMHVSTKEDFSYSVWDNAIKNMFSINGRLGEANLITAVPVDGLQVAAHIHESAQRGEYLGETVRGLYATHLQSTVLPKPIPLVPTINLPSNSFMILNTKAFRTHFVVGRGMAVYNQPLGQGLEDNVAQRWISEMTLEAQRPTENLYYHDNITYVVGS